MTKKERKALETEYEKLEKEIKKEIEIINEKLENASKDNLSAEEYFKLLDRKEQLLNKLINVLHYELIIGL